ncbi:YbaB/EbfC family nucleoid-associated protein [Enterococcus durans]|uniref:Nucleoid-associated protein F6X95_02160 n=1 Tax=Enterococcus durans TaxID=53345 RepID=A0A5N0YYN2_9ENTE|nr:MULTISPECIES: YbaB/EbfC family nucleoid-associated protein [Enterococcus]KAA9181113.1 YbaB/EbfC family nucleoid-associated protein [Enterococcus durans]KAA9188370.1 YbaB/EbfC family nucleoid-associated protein [Enterococcus durans]KAA9188786.1 YbaB/EbfC family nucleoid-associated protein [Enterococcus durans]KAA9194756.1 YbaB/EbfC family nucleoid-associated protein [Enterococcus durans]KAA9195841.1 YbaB/EbfC family nucleoid-associated protein [Enterococcus durans]
MMRGMGNMQGMMKQVQKMQKEMVQAQDKLNETEFTGTATNDLVKVVFTGNRRMKDLQINEGVVDPEDTEMLQDLVIMAVNDALAKIDVETEKTMGKYTKGLPF